MQLLSPEYLLQQTRDIFIQLPISWHSRPRFRHPPGHKALMMAILGPAAISQASLRPRRAMLLTWTWALLMIDSRHKGLSAHAQVTFRRSSRLPATSAPYPRSNAIVLNLRASGARRAGIRVTTACHAGREEFENPTTHPRPSELEEGARIIERGFLNSRSLSCKPTSLDLDPPTARACKKPLPSNRVRLFPAMIYTKDPRPRLLCSTLAYCATKWGPE